MAALGEWCREGRQEVEMRRAVVREGRYVRLGGGRGGPKGSLRTLFTHSIFGEASNFHAPIDSAEPTSTSLSPSSVS